MGPVDMTYFPMTIDKVKYQCFISLLINLFTFVCAKGVVHILADHEHLFWPMVNTNSGAS